MRSGPEDARNADQLARAEDRGGGLAAIFAQRKAADLTGSQQVDGLGRTVSFGKKGTGPKLTEAAEAKKKKAQ